MEEKEVIIKGIKSNFKVSGKGQPILVLHGWGASSSSWKKVQEILAKKGFKVFCPDLPGFGKTGVPESIWGVADYVDWVLEFTKSQNFENFILLGHSFGGRISIKFSNYYPNKVQSLVLCNSAGLKIKPSLKRRIVLYFISFLKLIFGVTFFNKLKEEFKDLFYFAISSTDYAKANMKMKKVMKRVIAEDLLRYLSGIQSDTLIVWGEKDKMIPLKHAHVFNQEIENSRLKIISGVGHSPHLEVPEKLSKIILDFLRK